MRFSKPSDSHKRTCVTFSETVSIRATTALDDYTDDEYFACWYSPDEYDDIEQEMIEDFKKLQGGMLLDDDSYCSRGLEQYLEMNAILRKENTRKAIEAVLDEQDRQLQLEYYNEEAISEAYQNVAEPCALWASIVGHRDEQEVTCAFDDDVYGDFEYLSPSNIAPMKNLSSHESTAYMTTLLRDPLGAFVSSLFLPVRMNNQVVAFSEGRRL